MEGKNTIKIIVFCYEMYNKISLYFFFKFTPQ